jgi:hypothetical protein
MATGFEKDESLLRDSEDWRSKVRQPLKPRNQSGFLKARQPPTKRPWTFSDDFERQQVAQLIKADGARVPHMQQDRYVARIRECDMALVIPHAIAPSRTTFNRIRHPDGSTSHRPRSLSTQSLLPNNSIASYFSPRKLIEMGRTPADFQPGLENWIAPCSADLRVIR